jgi:exportin-2 (importin alpha re-exporter)
MISVPERLQFQVSEALSIIASSDFPEDWQELLPVCMKKKRGVINMRRMLY